MARPSRHCLLFAALLPAAAAASATPSMQELMRVAFPGWSTNGPAQTVQLASTNTVWEPGTLTRVAAAPRLVLRTGPHSLTLIAGLVPADADGARAVAHPTPLGLGAYHFHRIGGEWSLERRQDGFGYQGYFGEAALRAVSLSRTRQGIAVESGSCWQGYCINGLALYELDGGQFKTAPVAELAVGGINVFGTDDCARRLRPLQFFKVDLPAGVDDGDLPHDCYSIKGTWSFVPAAVEPGDFVIHFKGVFSKGNERGPAGKPTRINQRLTLRYSEGKYKVMSGSNPVPDV